ncbi:tRNA (adenosine(37)-N6)-threonylcarbamoyltransferase complex ATPase subunit type 1 TsaE [Luteolibacter sp. AS25]|uniref:tRNA (adenosine(37)-N6)-threonylcarbamoyltransferase complex ATPase subunit type 1 TsaE n=1 Tax=Luteolibacter sp. AS25 TaxID=3135776 RepID=UPI00398A6E3A
MTPEILNSPHEMSECGARFASQAISGSVFALIGDLGAGKTHWSKGFIREIDSNATVSSPTFSIVNEYRDGRLPVFHFDFYRMKSEEELINLGWDEYLDESGILICEWANLFPGLMPKDTIWLNISQISETSRELKLI